MRSHGQTVILQENLFAISTEDQIGWPHEDLGLLHDISNFHDKITEETHPTSGQLYVFDWDQDLCSLRVVQL
jgi:hypothetical protein